MQTGEFIGKRVGEAILTELMERLELALKGCPLARLSSQPWRISIRVSIRPIRKHGFQEADLCTRDVGTTTASNLCHCLLERSRCHQLSLACLLGSLSDRSTAFATSFVSGSERPMLCKNV